jgi:hypothetical protein
MSFKRDDYRRTFDFALMVYRRSRNKEIKRLAIDVMASVEGVVGQQHMPSLVGAALSNELFRRHELGDGDDINAISR